MLTVLPRFTREEDQKVMPYVTLRLVTDCRTGWQGGRHVNP